MEVLFDKKAGYFKIIGFSILNFNAVRHGKPISVSLKG